MEPAADLIRWVEIEDIRRYPAIFEPGEPVVATEKIHGSACLLTRAGDRTYVSSKGYGFKNLALVHSPTNIYWRAVEAYKVAEAAKRTLDAGKPLDGPNLKAALNSIKDFDTGGLVGVPITISGNSIPVGRIYQADIKTQKMVPASDWIKVE